MNLKQDGNGSVTVTMIVNGHGRPGEPRPFHAVLPPELWMHLAVVACGSRVEETLVMLKSAVLFSHRKIQFHIFTEDSLKPEFDKQLRQWPDSYTKKFEHRIYPITFSVGNSQEWKRLFKPCAAQRLFLPVILKDVDSLLYVDTDVLFLRPVDDIWKLLGQFNSTQLAAMAPEHEVPKIGWYSRFARHPFYGPAGVNSGVMLMNLTRIRSTQFKNSMIPTGLAWENMLYPLYQKYKNAITWGDQDLLNIIFYFNPECLYVFPCQWNYRPDHCMYGSNCKEAEREGVSVLHGNRGVYHDDKQPSFRALYEAIRDMGLKRHFSIRKITIPKLKDFEKRGKKEVCPVLDQFLCHVAKTGETMIQWSQFKGYFIFKLEKVMDDFRTSAPEPRGPPNPNVEYIPFDEMKERILKIVTGFNGIPFTIQRLCELLTDPRRNYTGTDKFLRGVEKNVMVVSCVYPSSEKNNSNSLNRMNGVMFPGNSPSYTDRSNINGPGTPRPLNRPKVSLSAPLTTNGLPESTESKESNLQQNEEKNHSDSPTSESEVSSMSPIKNKYPDEDAVESEGHEVKRLRFDKEGEVRETASQTTSSEISSVMVEETEALSSSQDKDKENSCTRQHCTEEDEEEDEEEEEESYMTSRDMIPERKNQEKESDDALTVNEETSEENNQMEESDLSQAEKDLHSEGSENTGPVSSGSDCHETEELIGSNSSKTGDSLSESSMENEEEASEVTDEPMEQD
ncbi:Serine/threonine-protein phosphatase 4 regulatory subunit 2 [Fukomys damarensis]|uniref:UDP-D-xylose:beta-D-glucoside alpha-1,3-D-xylosyltransferase n=1 Tax=Fukomys damarensis TaxID=885580 RepID=A0A091DKL7_FUKDA|nr:Serine/threonine-protein phosphatase 4 regulatory subunit 2 [Fukomys damarensis]